MTEQSEPDPNPAIDVLLYGIPILCILMLVPAVIIEWWNRDVAPWVWGILGMWVVVVVFYRTWKRQQERRKEAENIEAQ